MAASARPTEVHKVGAGLQTRPMATVVMEAVSAKAQSPQISRDFAAAQVSLTGPPSRAQQIAMQPQVIAAQPQEIAVQPQAGHLQRRGSRASARVLEPLIA